jgi:hypothetical protein
VPLHRLEERDRGRRRAGQEGAFLEDHGDAAAAAFSWRSVSVSYSNIERFSVRLPLDARKSFRAGGALRRFRSMFSIRKSLAAGALALGAIVAFGASAQAQIIFGQPPVQGQVVVPQGQQPLLAYTTLALNLRTGPSTQYPVVLSMPTGSPVYVFYCGDVTQPWCYVNFNGYEGWASARYLTQNPPYVSPQPVYPQPTYPQQVYPQQGYPQVYTPQQIYPGAPMGGNFGLWFYVQ